MKHITPPTCVRQNACCATNKTLRLLKQAVLALLLFCSYSNAQAQSSPAQIYNAQLRAMFVNVVPPANSNRFLYDMSSHTVDSVFFGNMVTHDTTNPYNWTSLYEEMYHAAYDTSWLLPIEDVLIQAGIHGTNDTVSLAIITGATTCYGPTH